MCLHSRKPERTCTVGSIWTHIGRGTPICLSTTNTRMLLLRAAASSHALPSRAAVTPSLQSVRMRAFVATPALPYPRAAVAVTVLRHEDDCDTDVIREAVLACTAREQSGRRHLVTTWEERSTLVRPF